MNQNDVLAQQQAMINQIAQNLQHLVLGVALIQLALFVLSVWVIYMFYARLRDIADELRKLRISYEASHSPESKGRPGRHPESSPPTDDDLRYKPKG
jgi:hypothetical protein